MQAPSISPGLFQRLSAHLNHRSVWLPATMKMTSLSPRANSQFIHFSWEWNCPSPPVGWPHGWAGPSWPGALDVGCYSGAGRRAGRMEQTRSYNAYTYLSKRLKAELPGSSQRALIIPFLSRGSQEHPSSTRKSLDFVDATFSQHPLVTMALCSPNKARLLNWCLFFHFSLQTDPEH